MVKVVDLTLAGDGGGPTSQSGGDGSASAGATGGAGAPNNITGSLQ